MEFEQWISLTRGSWDMSSTFPTRYVLAVAARAVAELFLQVSDSVKSSFEMLISGNNSGISLMFVSVWNLKTKQKMKYVVNIFLHLALRQFFTQHVDVYVIVTCHQQCILSASSLRCTCTHSSQKWDRSMAFGTQVTMPCVRFEWNGFLLFGVRI
jgi:hypothetical protein